MKKKKPAKKWNGQPFLIGRYQLGWRMVNLYAEPNDTGAWFNLCRDGQDAQIHCGMDYHGAVWAFGVLCHEVWEMAMDDAGCAYKPKAFEEGASDVVSFFFNHNQHTEITARASFFIWSCFDEFVAAHKFCRHHRKEQKRTALAQKRRKG